MQVCYNISVEMQIVNAMNGMTEPPMSHDNMTHDMGHGGGMDHGGMVTRFTYIYTHHIAIYILHMILYASNKLKFRL